MLKTLQLVTVSIKPKEILHQILQGMGNDIHTPINNPDYYPLQGA
ncbi:hypothetical protein [Sulfurimonas sp.]